MTGRPAFTRIARLAIGTESAVRSFPDSVSAAKASPVSWSPSAPKTRSISPFSNAISIVCGSGITFQRTAAIEGFSPQ